MIHHGRIHSSQIVGTTRYVPYFPSYPTPKWHANAATNCLRHSFYLSYFVSTLQPQPKGAWGETNHMN